MRMTRWFPARVHNERGAVAAMTCVIIGTTIACAAFAVDAGGLWAGRRRINTATDAAALAAAQTYTYGGNGCAAVDDQFVTSNDSNATVVSCVNHGNGDSGYVTVTAKTPVEFQFARIFGMTSADVKSTTHARYGLPTGVTGLRPMGLCIEANAALTSWLNLPTGPTGDSGTIRIFYNKDHPSKCGGNVPGNWGMLDLDGGSNSTTDLKEWVLNGYPGQVTLSPPDIPGDTGAFSNSIEDELAAIRNTEFVLPLFDRVQGNGSNAEFRIVAFVKVKLIGYEVNGSQEDRYIDLQFRRGFVEGSCCGTGGIDAGLRAERICAVDPADNPTACTA